MSHLRHFLHAARTAPSFAHLIACASLATWIVKAVWLDFVQVDSQALVGLGHVVDGLLSAVIAGYVFYIIFAIYPEHRQRQIMAPFLFERVRSTVGNCLGVREKIQEASKLSIPFRKARQADVENAFKATSTGSPPPGMVSANNAPLTWPDFFAYRHERTAKAIEDLFQQSRFLNAELISLLTEVRNAPFYQMSLHARGSRLSNPDLSAWGPSYFKLLLLCRELVDWHDDNRMPGILPFGPTIVD